MLSAGIRFVAYSILSLGIFLFLLAAKPLLALAALVVFGGAHALFHYALHGYLRHLGKEKLRLAYDMYRTFSEIINDIKAIRTQEAFLFFIDRFETASRQYSRIQPRYEMIAIFPRYAIELLAFGSIIATVIFWLSSNGSELAARIPILTVFALAAYRLLPALNTASNAFAQLTHSLPVIDEVYRDFRDDLIRTTPDTPESQTQLPFERKIELKRVKFRYQNTDTDIVTGIDLSIKKGSRIALVGSTGSGKSTLMDIMVGLLQPSEGKLSVDGQAVTRQNASAWRRSIAYVAQEGFLYDESIRRNIAFGEKPENIDDKRLRAAAQIAQIDTFIEELPEGYDTQTGERGVRLSGGQRQRIGLARALYRHPSVLLLDEATSALDGVTEAAVMSALEEHFPDINVVMVAHRLSTVKRCDQIHLIADGGIAASGPYDELMANNAEFRHMVESTSQTRESVKAEPPPNAG